MKLNLSLFFTSFLVLCMTDISFAEYRVYQYSVKNKIISAPDQPNAKIILSTLNPVSYLSYHGGSVLLTVDLLRTWICPGYTGNKINFCPSPYDKVIERPVEE